MVIAIILITSFYRDARLMVHKYDWNIHYFLFIPCLMYGSNKLRVLSVLPSSYM